MIYTNNEFWAALCKLIPNLPRDKVRQAIILIEPDAYVQMRIEMYATDECSDITPPQTVVEKEFVIVPLQEYERLLALSKAEA